MLAEPLGKRSLARNPADQARVMSVFGDTQLTALGLLSLTPGCGRRSNRLRQQLSALPSSI
jgi:hypothetical protein